MADSELDDDPIDRVVERIMLGQDPDVEGVIAGAPDMEPVTRDKLRRIADAFGPARGMSGVALAGDAEPPLAELGPYRVLSRMGEGGMGVVYLAEHRFLQRRVALKVIRPELAFSSTTRQRFQREAMRIASLRHENIVSVYDAGEHEGVAFLAMELVEGPGLDDLLRTARSTGRPMDVVSAVRHARDIARALQCAHDAGIVHRDVKPSNVRITPDGRALLLDFGLSLAEEATSLSTLGQFRGTPQYASPEQIEAGSTDVDLRTDVYSLGITLYECLTGQVPFESASMIQLFHQILARDPAEPSTRNERVDPALNDIVMRAIAKRREDRYASAGDLEKALDGWLVSAERTAPAQARAPSASRRRLVAALAVVLLAAAWYAIHAAGRGAAATRLGTPPGDAPSPRRTTALLGDADRAFDRRLERWAPVVGTGTFGADEDGPGVLGICVDGIAAESYALPDGNGELVGRVEPISPSTGTRTQRAGAGLEFRDGRIVALLLVATADGYDLRVCQLTREGTTRLVRGADVESRTIASGAGRPLTFRLTWNEADTRFAWGDADHPADSGSFTIPGRLRGDARPSAFLLVVEQGSARFERLVLEESG